MISSMTGYGRGEVSREQITATAEIRTVNSRYFEVTSRLPRTMTLRENEVKEIIRAKFVRGKINVMISIAHENANEAPLKINATAAKTYYKLLAALKKSVKIREQITLDHLLKFPEVIEINEFEKGDEKEWELIKTALNTALAEADLMRKREGGELMKDLKKRIMSIEKMLDDIQTRASAVLPEVRSKLERRVKELIIDPNIVDNKRLEFEFALLVDKLDVTEECIRFRSHDKFFIQALRDDEASGRKLNFLIQEMNREANTIGSKCSDAEMAHIVVAIKEDLEKIREQLQNIE